jgi:hypothetical protein
MVRLRDVLTDPDRPQSLRAKRRERRWELFEATFPNLAEYRVLDLGGMPRFWRIVPNRPAHVTTVNVQPADAEEPWSTHVVADACEFSPPGEFDLVFSNSLIEHVGGHYRRSQLAEVIKAAAPRYWVQTPYRYFPVEPHFVVPGMQFLPVGAQAKIAQHWHAGFRPAGQTDSLEKVQSIELIGIRQLETYFPGAIIEKERIIGVPTSIIAVAK